ncbi:apolipoprotein N-acyltransferase [Sabulicella rubraurantiaca]|uniref:apolipoprotein N-acyltransferase n=1 Tax=Sabulicella rubraurantiaca TaxID=2811429 RepID=UPI002E2ABE6E|nr:apolipoprotein N-acyltransferase [Sabulicella rubraurantiaca]
MQRPAALATVLGALSALALPPVHLLPVLLLTVPGFVRLVGRAPTWRRAALLGFLFGFGHHVAGLYWVTHSLFTDFGRWFWLVPIAAPGLALPLALFSILPALVAWRAAPGWPRVLGFAGAWVLAEGLRGLLFTGFPWNLIGTGWAFHPLPLQPAAIIGTHGLSLVTILLAGLPLLGLRRAVPLALLILLPWMGFGAWRLGQPEPPAPGIRLVLVQGNVAQEVKWDEAQRLPIFRRYLDLTREGTARAAASGERVVAIWPETASPFLLAQDPEAIRLAALSLAPGATLLAGTVRAEWGEDRRLSGLWNSLVALSAEGETLAVFDKFHLVPFGEYMPLGGLIPIRVVTGGIDFSAGPGPVTLSVAGLPGFSPLICYEVIFPGAVTGTERPAWLVNITNDAWFGVSAGPFQHFAAARMRAVEEGLPLARAAQTGISAVVDARGDIVSHLELNATGSLEVSLPGRLPPTVFGRAGSMLPLTLALLLVILSFLRNRLETDNHDVHYG